MTKKDLAIERKLAREEKQKANICKVANFEEHLAEDDVPDIMPKPQDMNKCQLKCTISYAQLPLTAENISNFDDLESEAVRKDMHNRTETEHVVMEEEAPPKKKLKPGFHNAVRMYLDGNKGNTQKSKGVCQHADYVKIDNSQDDDDHLQNVQHAIILTKDTPACYTYCHEVCQGCHQAYWGQAIKTSTTNRMDNLDTESVGVVENNVGTKGGKNTAKGGKNTVNDQKGPGIDKPNW